jgi:alpha-ketoglutarate-dependent taurine dioxygenase
MKYHIHENGWTVILDEVDFSTITQDEVNELARLLSTNTLVIAHKQSHLTVEDELRVAHMFGNVEDLTPVAHLEPYCHIIVPGSENKMERVTGELDEHGQPGLFGHVSDLDWHCNMPADPNRKPLVWLLGVRGTAGSKTSWTNNIMAYNDLSDEWKERIKDLKMICGWKKGNYSEFDFSAAKGGKTEDYNEINALPMVHTNNGGQTGLFFPFLQFRNFVGLTEDESRAIIEPLRDHVLQEKYMYHLEWQDGDVNIAEQWLGIHKRWKFDGMPGRVLHRMTFDFANTGI